MSWCCYVVVPTQHKESKCHDVVMMLSWCCHEGIWMWWCCHDVVIGWLCRPWPRWWEPEERGRRLQAGWCNLRQQCKSLSRTTITPRSRWWGGTGSSWTEPATSSCWSDTASSSAFSMSWSLTIPQLTRATLLPISCCWTWGWLSTVLQRFVQWLVYFPTKFADWPKCQHNTRRVNVMKSLFGYISNPGFAYE